MSLLIANSINEFLRKDPDVSASVSDRIYPVVAVNGAAYPYIVLDNISVIGNSVKDGNTDDQTDVTISIVAETYQTASIIAENVRIVMEQMISVNEGYTIRNGALMASNCGYDGQAYTVQLQMQFETIYT